MQIYDYVPTPSLASQQATADSRLRDETILRFLEVSTRYFSQSAQRQDQAPQLRK
jgi:hypothetical protein